MPLPSPSKLVFRELGRGLVSGWVTATVFSAQALAQVRPEPLGGPDANIDIMAGRAWAGYFIGGFLLLIVLIIIRSNQVKKRNEREQARRHKAHMKKLKEERLSGQRGGSGQTT